MPPAASCGVAARPSGIIIGATLLSRVNVEEGAKVAEKEEQAIQEVAVA